MLSAALSSTLVWAFSVAAAIAFTLKVPRSSGFGVTIIAASTVIWAAGVSIHARYWSTVAFALLVGLFIFEAFAYGLIMLWKDYVLNVPEPARGSAHGTVQLLPGLP